ncbi:MAG: TOBE domain-containing protein [Solidesulfovibrio sp. DCME]|uniref:TOBE domain-containing protein n=1 Tax=Solidesulfovibrio sp. DCME TaxID=3447380 RepID=UPI003D0C949D
MQPSTTNFFSCTVTGVRHGALLTEVSLAARSGHELVSVVTSESFDRMTLAAGAGVMALIKPAEILVGKDGAQPRLTTRNNFLGKVAAIRSDGVAVEIMGQLEGGTPMCALVTAKSLESLGIQVDDVVSFHFKAFQVILSAE